MPRSRRYTRPSTIKKIGSATTRTIALMSVCAAMIVPSGSFAYRFVMADGNDRPAPTSSWARGIVPAVGTVACRGTVRAMRVHGNVGRQETLLRFGSLARGASTALRRERSARKKRMKATVKVMWPIPEIPARALLSAAASPSTWSDPLNN